MSFRGWKRLFLTIFEQFWILIKGIPPLYIGLLYPQICTDLRGVRNPWKIGGNPPIGGKEYTLIRNGPTFSMKLTWKCSGPVFYLHKAWGVLIRLGALHRNNTAGLLTSYWSRNIASCCTEILRSVSLNSYGMFHPIGPNVLRSWMTAWKKHSPYNNFLNANWKEK